MGFWDSFKESFEKGYEEESEKSARRQENSTYRTLAQKEMDRFDKFDNQNDSTLLRKARSESVSDEDKEVIDKILRRRGYRKMTNGIYRRI